MPSVLFIAASLLLLYCCSLTYRILTNLHHGRKSNIPYLFIPWDQNHFVWMLVSVPLRPWIVKNMPKWITDRISLTIYCFEFHEKLRPFEQYAAPQGNDSSYVIITPGKFEVTTRDAELATEILRRPGDFLPVDLTELFMGKFGSNVLISSGDSWARQRKVVASVINERISKTVFNESIHQTAGLLEEVLADRGEGESVHIFDMMKKITINVLSGAGMGTSVAWSDDANDRPSPGFKMTYIEAVKDVVNSIAGPIILPQWFLSNYPSFLPGYKMLKSLSYAMVEYPIHTRGMLEQERQRIAAHGETRSNIMSQLLHASDLGDGGKKGTKALSEEEMQGNLFIFTVAGFDTTANTLAYALVLLCRYPQWQEWLFEEIDSIMPTDTTDLDYTSLFPKATRVLAFMLEVLRLYPPVIHLAKMTKSPQRLQSSRGSFLLPAHTTIYINVVALHLDPAVWRNLNLGADEQGSADDECAFRPARWIEASKTGEGPQLFKPPKGTFVPWSAGPRVCPGQKMAQVEFTAIFLKLFHEHRIEAVALKRGGDGKLESRTEVETRLDARMKDSISILTLQMNNVYDVDDKQDKGLKVRLSKR